jgi:predicted nucleic acid-binding protein
LKLLLDTNVVLDLLMDRAPFADWAVELFAKVENGVVAGYLCGTTVTTVFYLAAKTLGVARARQETGKLLEIFKVAPVNRAILKAALAIGFDDFEDAVIHEAACQVGADAIVTRNQKDFRKSRLLVYSSEEMVKILASDRESTRFAR